MKSRFLHRLAGLIAATPLALLSHPALAQEGGWPDLGTEAHVAPDGSKDAAVVIGIDEYAFVAHVPGATHNATDWLTYLTESRHVPIEKVALLRDTQGTREGILKAASAAAKQVQPGGTLWFIFIGHGAPGQNGGDGLLVGADAQQTADSIFARSVSQSELLTRLAVGPASAHRVLVVDACFSGRAENGEALAAGLQPMLAVREAPVAGAVVLSAGASDQFAGPLPGAGRPAFSYLVLGALRGWAAEPNGNVTADDAVAYARQVLRTLPLGRLQEPRISGTPGSLVLAAHASEHAPNLHDIVIRPPETGGLGVSGGGLNLGSSRPLPPADEGPKLPGAIHAAFRAPLGDAGIWSFRDAKGATVCKLPCTRWHVPAPGYVLVRESPVKGEQEVSLDVPAETPFREGSDVDEQIVAPHGSRTTGIIFTSVGVASGVAAALLLYFDASSPPNDTTSCGNFCTSSPNAGAIIAGTTLGTVSLVGILVGIPMTVSARGWRLESAPGSQGPVMFHFSPQALEMTHGTTTVSLTPGGLSGAF